MNSTNIIVKRDYHPPSSQYRRITLVVRVMAGAALEPPTYLEKRGYDQWRKIREEVDRRLPRNKARFQCFAAIRKNTFFMELELDGKSDHVDEYLITLTDVVDQATDLSEALSTTTSATAGTASVTGLKRLPPPRPILLPGLPGQMELLSSRPADAETEAVRFRVPDA